MSKNTGTPSNPKCEWCGRPLLAGEWCIAHGESWRLPISAAEFHRREREEEERAANCVVLAKRLGVTPLIVREIAQALGLPSDPEHQYTRVQIRAISTYYFRSEDRVVTLEHWARQNGMPIAIVEQVARQLGIRTRILARKHQDALAHALINPGHMRRWTYREVAKRYGVQPREVLARAREHLGLTDRHIRGYWYTREEIVRMFGEWK